MIMFEMLGFSNEFSVQKGEGLTFLVVDNNAFCKVFRVRHAPRISFRCRREKNNNNKSNNYCHDLNRSAKLFSRGGRKPNI